MPITLPDPLRTSPWADRITIAIAAVRSVSAALMRLRGTVQGDESSGGQLKTSTDLAAEGWVVGFLRGHYPDALILAEEAFEQQPHWPEAVEYWTVDALDGTRSYVEGYDGFCAQVALIEGGIPVLGVICEPVTGDVYAALRGGGAWLLREHEATRLTGSRAATLGPGLRFVDSTPPAGAVGRLMSEIGGVFVECGGVGMKICRVASNTADVYAKLFEFKLWDVAPGDVLLRELGCSLLTWDGSPIAYASSKTHYTGLLACPDALVGPLVARLR